MKSLLIIVTCLVLSGCVQREPSHKELHNDLSHVTKIKVDNCQYVVFESYRSGGITHAGDCSNPAHKEQPK